MKNMKQALLVAGCLLATTTLFAQTEKGDWAQFGRYAKANKTVKVPSNVVFMGNSITDGWWPADSTFFIRNNFVDRGISGQTTSEMLVRFRQDVINLKPKAVVILAGINDIAHNNGVIALENVFGNLVSMAELAKANHIKVIFCSVLPAYDFPWRPGMQPADKVIQLNKCCLLYTSISAVRPYTCPITACTLSSLSGRSSQCFSFKMNIPKELPCPASKP